MAVGAQYRGDELSYDYDENANRDNFLFLVGNPDFGDKRDISAVFVELALPFTETLNLQARRPVRGLRRRRRLDGPKATLLWRPSTAVSLRASVGTAFRAPSLFQAFGTQTTLAELIDPRVGSPQFFPVRTQPNPNGATAFARGSRRLQRRRQLLADGSLGDRPRLLGVRLHERHHRAERAGAPERGCAG